MWFLMFLDRLFCWIANFCILIWHYGSELGKRWKLRQAAFRSAGDKFGRRGFASDVRVVPFLLQSKTVLLAVASTWSKRKSLAVQRWEAAQQRARQEVALDEVYDLKEIEGRCKRQMGYVPHFNPFATEFFWAALLGGGAIEFFLNSSALETGRQSEDTTRILAVILSLAFVFGVDLLGRHKAQGRSIVIPALTLTGLIGGITLIREDAVAGYLKHAQESVPELTAGEVDPRVYVLLFLCAQVLFFYIAYHWSVQHYDQLLAEHHRAKMAEGRQRMCGATVASLDHRLDHAAVSCLTEWEEHQRFFDHRVMIFIEAASLHRNERDGPMAFSRLPLDEPPVVIWSRVRLGNRSPHAFLAASA